VSSPGSSSKSPGPYRKPKADIYTVMLVIALVALVIGIVFLSLEMDFYNWEFKGGPRVSWLQVPGPFATNHLQRILYLG